MGAGLHAPHPIEAAIRQFQGEGIHHGEAALPRQIWRREGRGAGHLGRADADAKHGEAVIPGQDPGTAADSATHIENAAAGGQGIEMAPSHEGMNQIHLGGPEVTGPGGRAVMPQVHMVAPEVFKESVFRPAVVGASHAGGVLIGPIAALPEAKQSSRTGQSSQAEDPRGQRHGQRSPRMSRCPSSGSSPSKPAGSSPRPSKVSFNTVRAAS